MLAKLKEVHKKVTALFTYETDKSQYGKDEYWTIPEEFLAGRRFKGDCEDFSMACRSLLRMLDIESQLVICQDETGEMHCVLQSQGYILDNRQTKVIATGKLKRLGYKWIAISGNNPGDQWYRVKQ